MSRQYVVQEWSNAAADSYTGYQVNRHFRKNGSAAIENYADVEEKPAKKVKKPDLRTLEQKREDFLDKKRVQFEAAFESGEIGFDQYDALLTEWTKLRSRLDKRMGLVEESTTAADPAAIPKASRPSIMPAIERAAVSFSARHPFATLVTVIILGSMVMNIVGFGA